MNKFVNIHSLENLKLIEIRMMKVFPFEEMNKKYGSCLKTLPHILQVHFFGTFKLFSEVRMYIPPMGNV